MTQRATQTLPTPPAASLEGRGGSRRRRLPLRRVAGFLTLWLGVPWMIIGAATR